MQFDVTLSISSWDRTSAEIMKNAAQQHHLLGDLYKKLIRAYINQGQTGSNILSNFVY